MSNHAYPLHTRLSDSLERELMLTAVADEQRVSLRELFTSTLAAIRHGAIAVFNYVVALGEALNEARSKDPHNQYSL